MWMTKEEWVEKGRDPEQWRDKEEFDRRGEEILPIVNANNKKLAKKVEDLQSDMQKILSFNEKQAKKHEEEGYQRALKELEVRKKQAFDDADYDALEKADREKEKLVREHAKKSAEPETPTKDPEFEVFITENKDWYGNDPEMTEWADSAGAGIAEAAIRKGKTRAEAFEIVGKEVKARFPDKFQNDKRDKPPAVEGEAGAKNKRSGKKGWDDLPQSAKSQYERIKEQMSLKGREYNKEDYIADYEF